MKPKYRQLFKTTALVVVTFSSAAHAQTRHQWTGLGTTQNWNEAANWENGTLPSNNPGPGQHAVVNIDSPFAVISGDLDATPVDIFVGVDPGSNGRVDQTAGTASTGTDNWMFVGMDGGTGQYNASGGTLNVGGRLYVGGNGGTGTFNASNTNVNVGSILFIGGGAAPGGNGEFNLTGSSSLSVGTDFFVGASGDGASTGNFGTLTIDTTGTVAGGTFFNVGSRADSVGVLNLNAGTVTTNGWFEVGNWSGNGTLNMEGGSLTQNGAPDQWMMIGTNGATGLANISGGTLVASSRLHVGNGGGSTGTLNLSNDGSITSVDFFVGAGGGNGIANLNGGTLTTGQIAGGGTINFNGTQIIATGNQTNFMQGLFAANIGVDGFLIDTQTFNLGIAQGLVSGGADGGIVKDGSGSLMLTGLLDYTGPTVVNAGTLGVTDNFFGDGPITVGDGAGLRLNSLFGGGLMVSSASFGDDSSFTVNLGEFGNPFGAPLDIQGNLATSGTTTISVEADFLTVGQFPLITFDSLTGPADFKIGTLPDGVDGNVVVTANSVDLNVTSALFFTWTGSETPVWDTVTANWIDGEGFPATFTNGAQVVFDDFTAQITDVVLNSEVMSPRVRFENEFEDYTLTGTGKITGTSSLLKSGAGGLTIGTTNDYTGVTRLEGGSITVGTLTDGGVASPIGAASADPENLVFAGGALTYTGGATSTNRGLLLESGANTIRTDSDLTISGQINSELGQFAKLGGGNLILTHPGNNVLGGGGNPATRVDGGTLTLEGGGTQTNQVNGEIWVGSQVNVPAHLVLNNTSLTSTSWLAVARGNGSTTQADPPPPGVPTTVTLNNSTLQTANFSSGFGGGVLDHSSESVITLNNSTFTNTGETNLAESTGSTSTMILNGASTYNAATAGRIMIGQAAGTNGTVILNNTSGIVHGGSWVAIGNSGNGTLTMRNNSTFTKPSGDFNVADVEGSIGVLNIEDDAALNLAASITFVGKGPNSFGTVNQSGGVYDSTGNFFLGWNENSNGTWTMTGGELRVTNDQFRIGAANPAVPDPPNPITATTGTWNMEGGTVNKNGGEFFVGANSNGQWNQSGGVVNTNSWLVVGRFAAGAQTPRGVGELNLSGGTINQTAADRYLQIGEEGTGVVTISGDGEINIASTGNGVILGSAATGVGTLNLNGGKLFTNRVMQGPGEGTINFNGGLLQARLDANPDFLSGIDQANVLAGGAIIDSNGANITVAQNLQGPGSFTKDGPGTLTLSGITGYSGNTTVLGGTLSVPTSNLPNNGTVTIDFAAGATLNLPDAGSDFIGELIIDDVPFGDGEWNAGNTGGAITGSGTLVVGGTPPTTEFEDWVAGFFPGETNPAIVGPGADPDNDGQPNSLEFALGGDPSDGADNAKVFSFTADSDGDTNDELLMTIAVRSGTPVFAGSPSPTATHDGYTYTIQGSTTLESFPIAVTPVPTVVPAQPAPAGYEYRTFRLEGSSGLPARGFLRVEITP